MQQQYPDLLISSSLFPVQTDKKTAPKKKHKKGLQIIPTNQWLSKKNVARMLASSKNLSGVISYNSRKVKEFTASAPGMDKQHHIINSYLIGYQPFATDNLFIPWLTIAQKKAYLVDKIAHEGILDVWQNSSQAYTFTRGDCEDHAIALADWLICMGYDARVVIGKHHGGGHAWVVLLHNGEEFLLEATRKSGLKRMRSFPLAKLQKGYEPMYMFNRNLFWKNNSIYPTQSYRAKSWKKMSNYTLGDSI